MASIRVAVRVRPFSTRELNMGCQPIIEMDGKKTRILNVKAQQEKQVGESAREKYRDFTFDYSYWSYDPQDERFASQEQVFRDLGMDVVDNAFLGYNACVFAYGQTGSGKTHTMMGHFSDESQGLIPRICKDMFNRMNQGKEKGVTYRTEVSYLEIYNERVKDLLKKNQSHSLRVREHNKYGIYVEDLSKHLVMDYADIEEVMQKGNSNRTTASTNMNDVSSRSHAIFTMTFVQASFVGSMPSETISKIHLVDLAGSERADASGATGQRLKEGGHINKSLVTLGSVISALADVNAGRGDAQSRNKQIGHIPYRNSVLTWLLKDSLGGNSKTIMIATISPADVNASETLSTLRYANRAKNIINKPTINEDLNVKLIRELRAEISKLKNMLGTNDDSSDSVLEQLHEKEAKEKVLTEEWQHKWAETQKILMEQTDLALRKAGTGVVLDSQMPHLIGIDDDLLSTGITLYHLKEGETRIGCTDEVENHDIILKGPGLECNHCSILLENGVATLVPSNGAICIVNGLQIDRSCRLSQGCVIRLGANVVFRYNDPAEAEKLRRENKREGSRSHLNLSRLSFLSRSTSDLAWSSENLNLAAAAVSGEESTVLEEKRKQLEAEEVRLQKESQELLNQKALLEEQELLQQEKEEAWKAEQLNKSAAIHLAQKEMEDRRFKLEQEYAAHKKRLSEDWKKLEQQEQDTTKIISPSTLDTLRMSTEDATNEMKLLIEQINEQKIVVLESLENDCDKEVLNHHVSILQDLRHRYLKIECLVDSTARRRWLFEDEDSTFDFDKDADTTTGGDSELDESEAHSSVTDQDDHVQIMIEQGVQRRLLEIFEQLKSGQKPNLSSPETSALSRRRSHRRSMPSGLNHVYTSGSDDDGSSSSPPPLPRSLSMNSGVWNALNEGIGLTSGAIEITIPTYYLRGSGGSSHFQYEINIVTSSENISSTYTILRRYQRFRELYSQMKKKYSKVAKINFPPKKFFSRTSENVARERRKQLQTFLQTLICVCSTIPTCPLYNCGSRPPNFDVRQNLVAFSSFFEKGFFEGTKYGTS